jgi:hypothetical protein
MIPEGVVRELQSRWFPHLTDAGLDRLIQLLDTDSPLLIHGCFTRATPMGCLATHAAWHHPRTEHLMQEAGIAWLTRVAGLNPATSLVIREWDTRAGADWQARAELLHLMRAERDHRLATPRRGVEPERISDASLISSES